MCPPPPGHWVNVIFLQCDGTSGVSVTIIPEESEEIAHGRIYMATTDTPMMLKARIRELMERLLPGYVGSFEFVLTLADLLGQILNGGIDDDDNDEPEILYVRLSNPFLGPPPPTSNNNYVNPATTGRKRSRADILQEAGLYFPPPQNRGSSPIRPGGGPTLGTPTNPGGGNTVPSKKSRKDAWQIDTADPMDVLQDLIAKHLHGFVSAPGLKHTAKEIAMSAYFDWLDNIAPKHPGHVVIVGNPGVGKTTGAWALAKFLAESGIVRSENVVEAHRDDLIDRYVGGTEMKTNIVIHSARGGVVIFDEIYALNKPSSPNDSGKEALTTIMKYMTKDTSPVFMFLGYKKQMADFVNMNPGFQRRIKFTIEMQDYNPSSLAQIAKIKMEEMELHLEEGIELEPFFQGLQPHYLQLRNASVAVSLVTHALSHARKRTLELPPSARRGESRVIRKEDLEAAVGIIKAESKRSRGPDDGYDLYL